MTDRQTIDVLSDEEILRRFDLYGALYVFCADYHSGQDSRGYRILSKLDHAQCRPSPFLSSSSFESDEQAEIYADLVANYADKV